MTIERVLEKIIEIRRIKGISQKALAMGIGMDAGHLSMIERGKATLSMRRFLLICDFLKVLPQDVLKEDREDFSREVIMGEVCQKLLPEEMELLVSIAELMKDRHVSIL